MLSKHICLGVISLSTLLGLHAKGPFFSNDLPSNLNLGLREIVSSSDPSASPFTKDVAKKMLKRAIRNESGHVMVKAVISDRKLYTGLKNRLEAQGIEVYAEFASYREGVISFYAPIAKIPALAKLEGVRSLSLELQPITNIGSVTAQAAPVLRTDVINSFGFDGDGIKIGVISDSYDTFITGITAADDIASGDLPGIGNPLGNTTPIVVLEDLPPLAGIDEGRAMLQIIHDIAPQAELGFATAFISEVGFANNIVNLADPAQFGADIIVDDIIYLAEPMFSDGIVAQAVDTVAAQGVSYFSSAGNNAGTNAFAGTFTPVFPAEVDALITSGSENIDLSLIPEIAYQFGFHDFDEGPGVAITQTIDLLADGTLIFQWNDPYDVGGITADYDIYIWDTAGNFLGPVATDNFATDQSIEAFGFSGQVQIAIARFNAPTVPNADQLRYVMFGGEVVEFPKYQTVATYGHAAAAGAMGVGAYAYDELEIPEGFTAPGPVDIWFDALGNRLPAVETRLKPDFSALDGVDTTFFGADTDGTGFPNFFGTSASAPVAAAAAALVLEVAGGPGSLTPDEMRTTLMNTASPHDLDIWSIDADASTGPVTLKIEVDADASNASVADTESFKVIFDGPFPALSISEIFIDLAGTGLIFDTAGFGSTPFTLGQLSGITASDISATVVDGGTTLSIALAPGTFTPGDRLNFVIDRDLAGLGGGNAADLLDGATVTFSFDGFLFQATATFENIIGTGWGAVDGMGIIDPVNAALSVAPN
ncbi:MAG: S8 family peptidase [Opitutales bacterium]